MPRSQSSFVPFPLGTIAVAAASNGDPTVLVMLGEHDASNAAELSRTLASAAAKGHASVIIDMSGVEFMCAATIGALVGARRLLACQSRPLIVRAPSKQAARVLGMCGLRGLIDPGWESDAALPPSALASWVEVPPAVRHSSAMP